MLLAFDDNGPGPVVVLLHGFPFDRSLWSAQVAEVGTTYRLITPDLRGHGESAAPDGTYSIDSMADDVVETLDALQLVEPVVLGGHSMGGYVALSLALRYPSRVRALVLIDTRAGADSYDGALSRKALARQVEETGDTSAVVAGMLPKLFSPMTRERRPDLIPALHDRMLKTHPRAIVGALRGMAERPDRTEDLGKLNVPTLVIVGEDDAITPPSEARALAEALPNATLEVIPNAGHVAPVEGAEGTNRAIMTFLNGLA
jgi:pimeloyl-ACP methyl ester carboxylesterase